MKFAIAVTVLMGALASSQAFAKPHEQAEQGHSFSHGGHGGGHGSFSGPSFSQPHEKPGHDHGHSPVFNPGRDIEIHLPDFGQMYGNPHGSASCVPEPESVALLVGGLGVVGLMARRRQQNQ